MRARALERASVALLHRGKPSLPRRRRVPVPGLDLASVSEAYRGRSAPEHDLTPRPSMSCLHSSRQRGVSEMKRVLGLAMGIVIMGATAAVAAEPKPEAAPPRAIVTIYHIAPGKHLDFLKWWAAQEAVEKE